MGKTEKPDPGKVIAVCGLKNSGKTTLIERLIRELSARGLRTAVIKHDGHDFACDVPGTDSDRFIQAGAAGAAVFSASQMFVRKRLDEARRNEERRNEARRNETAAAYAEMLCGYFPEADVILIEGLKNSVLRKIEAVRKGIGTGPVSNPEGRVLVVTDIPEAERQFKEPAAGFDELDRILEAVLKGRNA